MIVLRRYFTLVPRVGIVGKPNVGKSSLFNRLLKGKSVDKAIVYDRGGTTRDVKSGFCNLGRFQVELSDTGGLEDDALTGLSNLVHKMREKTIETIKKSDLVLVVIDAKQGVTFADKSVASLVKKHINESKQRIVLVANKAEAESVVGEYVGECYEMDLGDPVVVSVKAGQGLDDLQDRMVIEIEDMLTDSTVDIKQDEKENEYNDISDDSQLKTIQIGIIGRPNAGKSSLLNSLVQQDRAIVDDHAGTTTDSIAVNWNFHKHKLRIVDTAGITRGWKHAAGGSDFKDPGKETLRTLLSSHVCVLVVDAHEAFKSNTIKFPSRQEVKLGNEVIDNGKCLVVAVNKWDMIPANSQQKLRQGMHKCIQETFFDIKGIPVVFISAKSGVNLNTLLVSCVSVYRKWSLKIKPSRLNDWLHAFVAHNPPPWKDGQKQYPKYITQTRTRPPTFSLYTNTFASFPDNYLRQMKELMKEEFVLRGIPLRINLRSTLMPKPGKKLRDRDVARWKRLGPKQAEAVLKVRKSKSRASTRKENELD